MACILVTGGAGFIGSSVAKKLISEGHEVKTLDLALIKNAKYHKSGSILDPYLVTSQMKGSDYVIHLAAALGVKRTEARRLECLYINIQGMVNVLEACVKDNVKKIVFASSSEVYGNQNEVPITEKSPAKPISNYAITKLVGEEYLRAYFEAYSLNYSVVRFFNVYGEEQRDNFVISKFVRAVCQNKPPVIYGDGKQVRSFCYVSDAVKGITQALFNQNSTGEIYNIGNDMEPINVKDLAEKVIHLSGEKGIKPQFVSMENSDRSKEREVYNRIPSIEKAKRILKYNPTISLDEGIRKVIEYTRDINGKSA
tara:strand:+ start:1632 stop:2564 length:933 start_codon:yes stop_codon:yes gene_type:complete